MKNTILIFIVGILLIILGGLGMYFYMNEYRTYPKETILENEQTRIVEPKNQGEPTNIPDGWVIYTNEEYGFSFYHPQTYTALDDSNNLYGWTNGAVLLYKGGQSYNFVVQVWNNQLEFDQEYLNQGLAPGIKTKDGLIYSLTNITGENELNLISNTFSFLD